MLFIDIQFFWPGVMIFITCFFLYLLNIWLLITIYIIGIDQKITIISFIMHDENVIWHNNNDFDRTGHKLILRRKKNAFYSYKFTVLLPAGSVFQYQALSSESTEKNKLHIHTSFPPNPIFVYVINEPNFFLLQKYSSWDKNNCLWNAANDVVHVSVYRCIHWISFIQPVALKRNEKKKCYIKQKKNHLSSTLSDETKKNRKEVIYTWNHRHNRTDLRSQEIKTKFQSLN